MSHTSSLLPVFNRRNVSFVSGHGSTLIDQNQQSYLDFGSGIAVNALGHCHPRLVTALKTQSEILWHCSNWFQQPLQEHVAAQLTQACFADYVFFCNSGLEANEALLKLARRYFFERGEPHRNTIVTFSGAFHGRSLATLTAAGETQSCYGPLPKGFRQIPFAEHTRIEAHLDASVAAVLLEPIQGDGGGVTMFPPQSLHALKQRCHERGVLVLYDEVQCGIGRAGALFAYQALAQSAQMAPEALAPDALSSAKGLGSGFPVGALLLSDALRGGLPMGSHGTTFGGNPLAMAVVDAVLTTILEPGFFDTVRSRGAVLQSALDALVRSWPDVYVHRRGMALMQGLKLAPELQPLAVMDALLTQGLITIPAYDNVIRLLPPLVVSEAEISQAVAILDTVAASLKSSQPDPN